eukprot:1196304-Prorocentrum_minimum.AAC.8
MRMLRARTVGASGGGSSVEGQRAPMAAAGEEGHSRKAAHGEQALRVSATTVRGPAFRLQARVGSPSSTYVLNKLGYSFR